MPRLRPTLARLSSSKAAFWRRPRKTYLSTTFTLAALDFKSSGLLIGGETDYDRRLDPRKPLDAVHRTLPANLFPVGFLWRQLYILSMTMRYFELPLVGFWRPSVIEFIFTNPQPNFLRSFGIRNTPAVFCWTFTCLVPAAPNCRNAWLRTLRSSRSCSCPGGETSRRA